MRKLWSFGVASFKNVGTASTSPVLRKSGQIRHAIASFARLLATMILVSLACCSSFGNGQKEPDAKRKAEIIAALNSHGFQVRSWPEAKASMHQIAAEHGWQTSHVPDARTLIFLGLGNVHSDTDVVTAPKNHLDPPYRQEEQ
jgi:hypothetical protein